MRKPPCSHGGHDGTERVAELGEAVLRLGRDDRVLRARDEAPALEFTEFFGEDPVTHRRARAPKCGEAKRFVPHKRPGDTGFPTTTEDLGRERDGARRTKLHATDTNKTIRTCRKEVDSL